MMSREMMFVDCFENFVVSEKSALCSSSFQIVVRVKPCINKVQIKDIFSSLFGVHVEAVRTMNVSGKKKRFGRFFGQRADWKKAYISIRADESGRNFMEKNNAVA